MGRRGGTPGHPRSPDTEIAQGRKQGPKISQQEPGNSIPETITAWVHVLVQCLASSPATLLMAGGIRNGALHLPNICQTGLHFATELQLLAGHLPVSTCSRY